MISPIGKFSLLGSVVGRTCVFPCLASSKLSSISARSSFFGLMFIASAVSSRKLTSYIPVELGLTSFLEAQEVISKEKSKFDYQ